MEIRSSLVNRSGQKLEVFYKDIEFVLDLGGRKVSGVHAYCFCKDKLVVVFSDQKGYWTPPGGGVEEGETIEEAVSREIKEETNMRVVSQKLLGFQDIFEPTRTVTQTRSVCLVEPIGPFLKDPDGEVTEIKLINPGEAETYFNWGEVGGHLLKRAVTEKDHLK